MHICLYGLQCTPTQCEEEQMLFVNDEAILEDTFHASYWLLVPSKLYHLGLHKKL